MALLERYPNCPDRAAVLRKAVEAFDGFATSLDGALQTEIFSRLEELVESSPPEAQGNLFAGLGYSCMRRRNDYPAAARFFRRAVQLLPDSREKVEAYRVLAAALREVEGEEAFLESLKAGRRLANAIGVDTSEFDKKIENPRPRRN